MHRRLVFLLSLTGVLAVFACQDAGTPTSTSDGPAFAAGGVPAEAAEVIPGRYIVVFNKDVTDAPGLARRLVAQHGGAIGFVYEHALKGFSASLPDAAVAALGRNPNVAYIEQDQVMRAVGVESPTPSWGLDRVDQLDLPLDNSYTYATDASTVTTYIIDTGILFDHTDFGGRAVKGVDEVTAGGSAQDCNGHGTHVSGTVGGSKYGIAKGVHLVAVRVLDCGGSGSTSGVIAGIDWVTANHAANSVANMSLGGGSSSSLNAAVANSVASGVVYAVAAGNGNLFGIPQNACNSSPASEPSAITVGATDKNDHEASFSNYGTCVDILAPGVSITSDWYSSNTATNTISGTSMATPHVTAAAALYLGANPGATPAQVTSGLLNAATPNTITLNSTTRGTPNKFLYTVFGGAPPSNQPPVASFTFICPDLACNFDGTASSDDGVIQLYSWAFGDGATGSGITASHTYASAGTRTVTLTVTDNGSPALSSSTSKSVTVSSPPPAGYTLSARGYKVRGGQNVDLTWSGAGAVNDVDVYRNGNNLKTTANDGTYTDPIGAKGSATYVYKVCDVGTSTCSNEATVIF
jgi:subtilisin family serine protease